MSDVLTTPCELIDADLDLVAGGHIPRIIPPLTPGEAARLGGIAFAIGNQNPLGAALGILSIIVSPEEAE